MPEKTGETFSPRQEYVRRLAESRDRKERQNRLEGLIGAGRVAVFLAGLATAYLVFAVGWLSPYWLALPLVLFFTLVDRHERVRHDLRRADRLIVYHEKGLARLDDRWAGSGDTGNAFLVEDHPYALDLDIFGKGSLFERLSLAQTRGGSRRLADWLCAPAAPVEVQARQEAVAELRHHLDLRQDLALLGADVPAGVDLEGLGGWGESPPLLAAPAARTAAVLFVVAGLAVLAAWLGGELGPSPYLLILLLQAGFARYWKKRVDSVIAPVERRAHDLALFAGILARIEREPFRTPILRRLQSELASAGLPPSRRIHKLVKLAHWLDCRHNTYFALLAPLVLWTTQLAFAFEAWRLQSGPAVRRWLDAVADFEALNSLAAYAFENPDDPFPELVADSPCFDGEALGHPLLPSSRCVRNDLQLDAHLRVLVISGSNMSGKSTMLRTVGINAVLAQAGAPVRASRLRLSPLTIGATLRVQDSLQAGRSRFFAEITRIRQLVDLSRGSLPLLFLLDEVLHGTNSHDRRHGAEAVVRGLVDRDAIGLVTTHDLALTHITEQLAPRAANVHFEDHFENGTITFDYRMRPGVVQKSNAIALMRAVGLEV